MVAVTLPALPVLSDTEKFRRQLDSQFEVLASKTVSNPAAVASVEVDLDVVAVGSDDDATTRNDGIVEDSVGRSVRTVDGCGVGTVEGVVVVGDTVT